MMFDLEFTFISKKSIDCGKVEQSNTDGWRDGSGEGQPQRCGFSQKSGLSLAPFSKPLSLSREPGRAESPKLSGPKCPEHNRSLFIRLIVLRSEMFLAWGAERMTVESRQTSGRLCCYLCSPENDQKCPLICARPLSDTHLPFRWNQRSTPETRPSVARLCTQTILIQVWFSCQASKCPSGCLQ